MKEPINPNDFRLNEVDNDGSNIERIYYKSVEYVVYRTRNAIRIDFDDDLPSLKNYSDNHHKLGVQLARIYSWLPESLSWSEPINRQIARAIVVNIMGREDDAKQMLDHAEVRIKKLKEIQGKLQYTLSSFAVVAVMLTLLIISQSVCKGGHAIYIAVAFCGALGGVLSVATGYGSLDIDIDATTATNCLIGASRIVIAMSASVFMYFAITSEVLLAFLGKLDSNAGIFLASIIAGFSERMVPNILSKMAESAEAEQGA